MSDVMQLAQVRKEELANMIAKYEAKIRKAGEEIETLNNFLRVAESLIHGASSEEDEAPSAQLQDHDNMRHEGDPLIGRVMPARQAQSA